MPKTTGKNSVLDRKAAKARRLLQKEASQRAKMEKTRDEIAETLRDLRLEQGMTLGDIQEATGFDPSTISVIERGKTFKPDTIEKLVDVYAATA